MEDFRFIRKRAIELLESKVKEFYLPERVVPRAEEKLMRYEYWKKGSKYNPKALAAASLYIELIDTAMTQELISSMFEISGVTLRSYAQDMISELKLPGYTGRPDLWINAEVIKRKLEEKKAATAEEKRTVAATQAQKKEMQDLKKREISEYLRLKAEEKKLNLDWLNKAEKILERYKHRLDENTPVDNLTTTLFYLASLQSDAIMTEEEMVNKFGKRLSDLDNYLTNIIWEAKLRLPATKHKSTSEFTQEAQENKKNETISYLRKIAEEKEIPESIITRAEQIIGNFESKLKIVTDAPALAAAAYYISDRQSDGKETHVNTSKIFNSSLRTTSEYIRRLTSVLNISLPKFPRKWVEKVHGPSIQEIQEKKMNESIEYLSSIARNEGLAHGNLMRAEEIIKSYQHKLGHHILPSSVASAAYYIASREKGCATTQAEVSRVFNKKYEILRKHVKKMLSELNIKLPEVPRKEERRKVEIFEIQEQKKRETLDLIKLKVGEENLPLDAVPLAEKLLNDYKQNIKKRSPVPVLATAAYHVALNQNKNFISITKLSQIFDSNPETAKDYVREMAKKLNIPYFQIKEEASILTPSAIKEFHPFKYQIKAVPNNIELTFLRLSGSCEVWFSQGEEKYAWVYLDRINTREKIIELYEKMSKKGFKMPEVEEFEKELMKLIKDLKS
jgi:transcription initiation factor TFIIIB Brf1 subunit/transcription initiation factor TFIIB